MLVHASVSAAFHLNAPRFLSLLPPLHLPRLRYPGRRLGLGFPLKASCCRSAGSTLMSMTSSSLLSSSPLSPVVKDRIDLTEKEEKIFQRLLNVVRHFQLETQLRVAGGWVRDKLLGRECYDIDIALDNMLGREFCEKVNEYSLYAGEETQGIGVIQCNPDQSKHLETARMRILDTWIDFVNLRSETYVQSSRIPNMKFGTAEEDAYRRDLTINSLFYNINTSSVEDLTGRGVEDLKSGIIITPLPPKSTFLDDPLRVLRAIRFGARFGFILDQELKKAAADEDVKTAISDKISRERIGHEIDLMISANQPVKAMAYICDLQLFWAVFTLPLNSEPALTEESDRICVAYIDAAWNILQLLGYSSFSDEQRRLYLYGALCFPLRNLSYTDRKSKKGLVEVQISRKHTDFMVPGRYPETSEAAQIMTAQMSVLSHIIRNSLKLKTTDAEMVASLHRASERFISFITYVESSGNTEIVDTDLDDEYLDLPLVSRQRILAGLLLRQIKDFWRVALLMSTLLYPEPDNIKELSLNHFELDKRKEMFRRVEDMIIDLGLDNVWEVKPLLDGNTLMNVLQLKTGGPQIREWQQRVIKWQLGRPEGTAEECVDWIKESCAKRPKLT